MARYSGAENVAAMAGKLSGSPASSRTAQSPGAARNAYVPPFRALFAERECGCRSSSLKTPCRGAVRHSETQSAKIASPAHVQPRARAACRCMHRERDAPSMRVLPPQASARCKTAHLRRFCRVRRPPAPPRRCGVAECANVPSRRSRCSAFAVVAEIVCTRQEMFCASNRSSVRLAQFRTRVRRS